jgi:long-chain acyl-CoA synthetase
MMQKRSGMARKQTGKTRKTVKKSSRKTSSGSRVKLPFPWLKGYPEGIDWHADLRGGPVQDLLAYAVERHKDRPCTNFLGKRLTYGEIGALVDRTAAGLQKRGIGKGDHVGLLLPNSPTYVVFYYAVLRTGATVVNYNPLYTAEELESQIRDSRTSVMVTHDLALTFNKVEALIDKGVLDKAVVCSFANLLPPLKRILFRLFKSKQLANVDASSVGPALLLEDALQDNDGAVKPVKISPAEDVAVLQYTGGTTGTPKGAMLTHDNLTINIRQIQLWARNIYEGDERFMAILPFFHVFAMTSILNFGVAMGSEMILMPRFELNEALKLMHKCRPTVLPGVPTLFNALMNHPKIGNHDLSSLKFCISGGAALPLEIKRGFEKATSCTLVEGYGLSETSPVATCNPVDGPVREGSIGLPLPGTTLSIRSLEDPSKEMPLGEDGEICIAGPQVMAGYWNNDAETEESFAGEYFRSGDVGHMDEEGFTYIVDRLKDMIIASGFNIYPRRIEEAIYEHPAVEEVTVVGIPDEYRGEAPKAFIKLRKGKSLDEKDILDFLGAKISKLEMPEEIEFRDELPKTMIGKLSKKELRAEAETG